MSTTTDIIPHPITGEALELTEMGGDQLAGHLAEISGLYDGLRAYKAAIVAEIARRADATGSRKISLQGVTFEVNAPTEDQWEPDTLAECLRPLVESGHISADMIDNLIVTKTTTSTRVDRRRIKAVQATDDRKLLAAINDARVRVVNTRTAKIIETTPTTTAEEV